MSRAETLFVKTLSVDRNISNILSTARISAIPSPGRPIVFKTTIIEIKPPDGIPAIPNEAKRDTIIINKLAEKVSDRP